MVEQGEKVVVEEAEGGSKGVARQGVCRQVR